MKILHIANDFAGSKVHSNLMKTIDGLGMEQIIYCPVREKKLEGVNQFEGAHTHIVYSNCIKKWYKYLYYYKEKKLYNDIKSKIDLSCIDVIHAHTMFSDGGIAYKAFKEYGTKYVVALRNTDVNDYIRLMKHTYPYGHKILLNAEKIIFISTGLKKLFETSSFCKPIFDQIKDKMIVQPNGIEDYWLEHLKNKEHKGHNVLYIGDFTPNKNVERLINAIVNIRKKEDYLDCKLFIIGGGRDKNDTVKRLISNNSEFVNYLGKIYDKSKIAEVMSSCSVFAMPSITETFGLVYLEALSQNLPVVFTKCQGIDGMFDESVGIGVNPFSVDDISNAIIKILSSPISYNNRTVDFNSFKWKNIANNYIDMYNDIMK